MTAISERVLAAALMLGLSSGACSPAARPAPAAPPAATSTDVAQSIVIVSADGSDVDMAAPWGTGRPWNRTLSGVVVAGHGVLVGGWWLHGFPTLQVQKPGSTSRVAGRIVVLDRDCGLALLTVDDPGFWIGLAPAVLASTPPGPGPARLLHANTEGARIEVTGAAVGESRMVGRCELPKLKLTQVDTKHVSLSDVIGSATEVVGVVGSIAGDEVFAFRPGTLADFVAEAQKPSYRGFAAPGAPWQSLTNPALRQELGLGPADGGVRIVRVYSLGSAAGALQVGDVLLTIDGRKVDSDGSCDDGKRGRLPLNTLITDGHHPGDVLQLGIVRGGSRTTVSMTLKAWPGTADLVPWLASGSYDVEGGLVFENLSAEYLQIFGKDWDTRAPSQLLQAYWLEGFDMTPARSRVVVMTRVLADPATLGYEHLRDLIVESINGVPLRSLDDVQPAFAKASGGFDVVTFAPGQRVRRIVLDAQEVGAANKRIAATYSLPNK